MKAKPNFMLPASVTSPQDITSLQLELHDYARWFSHNSIKKQLHTGHADNAPELSPQARELLRTWSQPEPLSVKSLDKHMHALEEYAHSAPQITITLAAPAPVSLKQTLTTWCRQNLAPNMLVNFEFNSGLCGGMVVRYGSRMFDWSFRRQILENKQKFPEVLKHV